MTDHRIVFLYNNFADDPSTVLSGGSYLSALPITNLQDQDIGVVARTSNALNASTIINANLGRAQAIGGVVVGPINSSPGSTYRFRCASDSGISTSVYDTGVLTIPGLVSDPLDLEWNDPGFWDGRASSPDDDPTYVFHIVPAASLTDTLKQYVRISLFDSANLAARLDIGRLGIFRQFRPDYNFSEGNALDEEWGVDETESLGGKISSWRRFRRRVVRLPWEFVTQDELFSSWYRMRNRLGTDQQLFVCIDPDDSTNIQKNSFLATFKAPSSFQLRTAGLASLSIELREVV